MTSSMGCPHRGQLGEAAAMSAALPIGSAGGLLAQDAPCHIGAQLFAENACALGTGCALDLRASLGRHQAFPLAPLIHSARRDVECACHFGLPAEDFAGSDDRRLGFVHAETVAPLHDERKALLSEAVDSIAPDMKNWSPEEEAAKLAERFVGVNQANFARQHKMPGGASMISQHIKGHRPIAMAAAVAYARGFGVPLREISPRLAAEAQAAAEAIELAGSTVSYSVRTPDATEYAGKGKGQWSRGGAADVEIAHFETGGSMGSGVLLRDQPGVIQSWRVTREWIQKNVKSFTATENLCIVTGFGDSMRPLFNPGDPLLVDIGVKSVEFDAVYFFRVNDEGFIKRVQRIPEGDGIVLRAHSANREHYEPFTITDKMDFEVLGRVLKVWKGEEF